MPAEAEAAQETIDRLRAEPRGVVRVSCPSSVIYFQLGDRDPAARDHEWRLDGPDAATAVVRHRPRFVTEDMAALRLATLHGVGICQLPEFVVESDLRSGRLINVLPEWAPKAGLIHAAFPSRRGLLPSVRAVLDFLAAEYDALTRAARGDAPPRRDRADRVSP